MNEHSIHPEAANTRFKTLLRKTWPAVIVLALVVAAAVGLFLISFNRRTAVPVGKAVVAAGNAPDSVTLTPEMLASAGIETVTAEAASATEPLAVTGVVESNQQETQEVTPLVGGRVERVNYVLGDTVKAGTVLAVISSPQVAELCGRLHDAQTQLARAERNLARVERAENRVSVLQARAKLDEAEATLRRTRRLIDLGAAAGKDLVQAEAAYATAKAEFDFQNNIALNREVQEARAALETAKVEVKHFEDQLHALGADVPDMLDEEKAHKRDTSLIELRAPIAGTITDRMVNAGAGIEPGKPLFMLANLARVWVIANVQQSHVADLSVGTPVNIRSGKTEAETLTGKVNYIDPRLNPETRTARVRIEVPNTGGALKVGLFVDVLLQRASGSVGGVLVPSEAVQRLGERTIVFVPVPGSPGRFVPRDVRVGTETDGKQRVTEGLQPGETVVGKGGFTLKTQLLKGEMQDDGG